ncbi:hypothetical protein JCM5353_000109 [Sporobolomyces roseus]
MNQIQQIQRINQQELDSGATASWHDQYKESAYINVGGLPFNLTEGDVIAIFSQYGEIVDINMPRDKATGKVRGFAWIMYYDQRSTILAVDNLNGATVLGRMIRVDHTLNYKQMEEDKETGKLKERENQSFAADPRNFVKDTEESDAESEISLPPNFDPEDPMAEYILAQHREAKQKKRKRITDGGGGDESKEEKKRRKEERRLKREERERRKGVSSGRREIEGKSRTSDRKDEREYYERRGNGRDERRRDSRSPPPRRRDDDYERDSTRRRDEDRDRYRDRDSGSRGDDDRDSRRSNSRREETDNRRQRDSRGGGDGGRGSAFSDLEKWARG